MGGNVVVVVDVVGVVDVVDVVEVVDVVDVVDVVLVVVVVVGGVIAQCLWSGWRSQNQSGRAEANEPPANNITKTSDSSAKARLLIGIPRFGIGATPGASPGATRSIWCYLIVW